MKTDVKKAVSAARNYLQSLQDAMGGNIKYLRLEEVEISEDEKTLVCHFRFYSTHGNSSK